uniref:Retrovirus-related Pol polyprotein from transposon TNT 1-94 n=1 Tax=Rhabditophanes sp. KR3021 TaxID=114890 RepID=A0AC35UCJ9_9BILA
MSVEERKDFVEMISLAQIPYARTPKFEEEKYRNYEQTWHLRDSMFLFLGESLLMNRLFENAKVMWDQFENDLQTMVHFKTAHLSSFLFKNRNILYSFKAGGFSTTIPEYQLIHHTIYSCFNYPAFMGCFFDILLKVERIKNVMNMPPVEGLSESKINDATCMIELINEIAQVPSDKKL